MLKGFMEIEIEDLTDMVGYMESILEASLSAAEHVNPEAEHTYNASIRAAFSRFKQDIKEVFDTVKKDDLCQCPACKRRRANIN